MMQVAVVMAPSLSLLSGLESSSEARKGETTLEDTLEEELLIGVVTMSNKGNRPLKGFLQISVAWNKIRKYNAENLAQELKVLHAAGGQHRKLVSEELF